MNKQITLSLEQARELYGKNPEMDELLLANFSKKKLIAKDFREIKTLADAAEQAEYTPGYLVRDDSESIDEWAYRMIKMVVKAINQGWTPDWNSCDQYKYYPWFRVTPGGVGFSDSYYDLTYTHTSVGSRLCFESSEKCKYAAEQFIEIYKQFLL